jgi:putative membrane protein
VSRLIIRLVINAIALWVAAYLVPGIGLTDNAGGLVIVALVFGLVNAFIRPIVAVLSCPFYVLTLGLFTFIVNAFMLWLTAQFSGGNMAVEGIWPAILGGIVVGIVSFVLSMLLGDGD